MKFIKFLPLIFPCLLFSQVGIGTTSPKASLDIAVSDKTNPSGIDGILIPRLEKFPTVNPTADQHGMLVFLTKAFQGFSIGFYYWNATENKWKSIVSDAATANFYKEGTAASPNNIDDPLFRKGNVAIGTEQATAKLQIAIESITDLAIKKGLEIDNRNMATDNLTTYGFVNTNRSATNGNKYGIKSNVNGDGIGIHYGIFNESFQNTGTNDIYGIFNRVGRTYGAKSNNFGIYSEIGSTTGQGNIYGIYSIAWGDSNSNIFAGYFAGRVGIGLTPETEYVLPTKRGLEGQVMAINSSGQSSWTNPGFQNYSSTTSATGDYVITDEIGTLRINNQMSAIVIPQASLNKGRIIRLISWVGTSEKPFTFLGGDDLFDVRTNSKVTSIKTQQVFTIQSAGNRWLLLDY
ncbi:MAG: hypothetical protein WBV11_16460 [Salegentibacter sp.]